MKKWNPNCVHTCYGCKQFYPEHGKPGDIFPVKHCGGDHFECSYFLGIGKPDVGCYAKENDDESKK